LPPPDITLPISESCSSPLVECAFKSSPNYVLMIHVLSIIMYIFSFIIS
jgi:hypothetical protein